MTFAVQVHTEPEIPLNVAGHMIYMVHCWFCIQVIDFVYCILPGSVQMKRVKFETVLEIDYINNFKLVQAAFNRVGVTRVSGNSTFTMSRFSIFTVVGCFTITGFFFP